MRLIRLHGLSQDTVKPTRVTIKFDDNGKLLNPRSLAMSSMVGWGKVQYSHKAKSEHGDVWWVSTPGHGGYILVTQEIKNWAKEPSIKVEHAYGNVYVYEFEEDCDWAILEYHDRKVLESAVEQRRKNAATQGIRKDVMDANQWLQRAVIPCLERWNKWVLEEVA